MKKLGIIILNFLSLYIFSQSDTLYLRDKQKIPVKLYEVSEYEIKYRRTDVSDGPIYTTSIENILKIKYSNGKEQIYTLDELYVQQDVKEIVKQRTAYKFHIFDLPTGKISFGFEQVMRTGINADFKVGVFNSNLLDAFKYPNNNYSDASIFNRYGARFVGGTFIRAGAKFLIGQDFNVKGMRYAHLLNGAYIRFDVYASYIKYDAIKYYIHTPKSPGPWYGPMNAIEKTTDGQNYNAGFLLCMGKQHVLANLITIEYYAGLGYNASSYSFTQNDFKENGPVNPDGSTYYYYNRNNNVLAAQRIGDFISGTSGLSVGSIHKPKEKPSKTPIAN